MSKKLITSIVFGILALVFIIVSYLAIGTSVMTKGQALALWFTAAGVLIACGLSFLFADSKPITSTLSIVYVVLSFALGAMEMVVFKEDNMIKFTIIIQLVLLAIYVIACLFIGSSTNPNDYEKDENGKNIYKKAG